MIALHSNWVRTILMCLAIAIGTTVPAAAQRNIAAIEERARQAYERGEYDASLQLMQQVVAANEARYGDQDNRVAFALLKVGMLLNSLGRHSEAEATNKRFFGYGNTPYTPPKF